MGRGGEQASPKLKGQRTKNPPEHRTPYLIKSLVLAPVDPFVEGFDPGFLLFSTRGLEFDVTDL